MVSNDAEAVRAAFGAVSVSHLGSGTFGETWKVESLDSNGKLGVVAVKLLRVETHRPHLVKREVEGLQSFDDRRVVRLLDVREIDVSGESKTALICEYVPGGDVSSNLRQGRPSSAEVTEFAIQVLTAIRAVHDVERLHRDLKMENIILRDGAWGSPVLIDFGLSKAATDSTFTRYPQLVGSLPYMSPEQLRGERARKASDLWAIGILLYAVISTKHPFVDNFNMLSEDEVLDLVVGAPRPLPDGVPPSLASVITRLLSVEPYERGSARRALKELRKAIK